MADLRKKCYKSATKVLQTQKRYKNATLFATKYSSIWSKNGRFGSIFTIF